MQRVFSGLGQYTAMFYTVARGILAPPGRRLAPPLLGWLQMADLAENGWVRKGPLFDKL